MMDYFPPENKLMSSGNIHSNTNNPKTKTTAATPIPLYFLKGDAAKEIKIPTNKATVATIGIKPLADDANALKKSSILLNSAWFAF